MQSSKLNMIGQYVHIINKLQIQLKMLLTTQKKDAVLVIVGVFL